MQGVVPVDQHEDGLQQASGSRCGAHIGVAKSVPAQAGMGGGSSDAASCLLALNRLWSLGLSLEALERIGLQLGADVPFFLRGRNAWVEGIGEQITPIDLPESRFVVVKPPEGLETAKIFCDASLSRSTEAAILAGFAAVPSPALYDYGRNDLQPVAQRLCPGVTQALEWLAAQGLQGRMTGSGSAVFARLPEGVSPSPLPAHWGAWHLRVCSNMAAHPLKGWAASDKLSVEGSSDHRPV
jgi:4-diphosphocytidyl-2-C-methyl-D-erythritol kinase